MTVGEGGRERTAPRALREPIVPGGTLGVVGGGQLGRYFALEARRLGYRSVALDPDARAPAMQVVDEPIVAAYDDAAALDALARACDAVTIEFENVPAESLERLARAVPVAPGAESVRLAQDRVLEKRAAERAGLRCPAWSPIDQAEEVDAAAACTGLPAILKTMRLGYDGKGQARCATVDEVREAFARFGAVPCVLERRVTLASELSVVLARGYDGETRAFAPAVNEHRDGILARSSVAGDAEPEARPALAGRAVREADELAAAIDHVGVLAVEFFVDADGELLFNEMAPRPHNSGHHTLDATDASQFEQQLRALCALPLARPVQHSAACMLNLLGELWADGPPPFESVLGVDGARLHLYGKAEARPGRKMGHVSCLGTSLEQAQRRAAAVRARL